MPNVLFLALGNTGAERLEAARESREIRKSCHTHAGTQIHWAVESDLDVDEFAPVLRQAAPDVLHFSGHGNPDGSLALEGGLISPGALVAVLKAVPNCRLVVLNACYAQAAVPALLGVVPYVIATPQKVRDWRAISFAQELYARLVDGADLPSAVESARILAEWEPDDLDGPMLYVAKNAPADWRLVKKEIAELRARFAESEAGEIIVQDKAVRVVLYLRGVAEGTMAVLYELAQPYEQEMPDGRFRGAGPGGANTFEREIWAPADSTVRAWLLSPGYLRTLEEELCNALDFHYAQLLTHEANADRFAPAFAMIALLHSGYVHSPTDYETGLASTRIRRRVHSPRS